MKTVDLDDVFLAPGRADPGAAFFSYLSYNGSVVRAVVYPNPVVQRAVF
jgi:hypothetical protein